MDEGENVCQNLPKKSLSSRNAVISCEARKDDEGVYGEYTSRRTDEAAAEITTLQQNTDFLDRF